MNHYDLERALLAECPEEMLAAALACAAEMLAADDAGGIARAVHALSALLRVRAQQLADAALAVGATLASSRLELAAELADGVPNWDAIEAKIVGLGLPVGRSAPVGAVERGAW